MSKESKFWDRMAEKYAKQPIADEAAYKKKLEVTQSYFRPDMQVLEVGCGTGTTALIHAPHVKHILAIDYSAKMIEIARRKAVAENIENVTFEQASIDTIMAPAESYDVVMAHSVLHLLEDRDAVVAKLYRLLKPGGVFVSNTTCLAEKMKFFRLIAPIGKAIGLIPLVKVFSRDDLVASLTAAGFDIDYEWRAENKMTVFIVAKKPE